MITDRPEDGNLSDIGGHSSVYETQFFSNQHVHVTPSLVLDSARENVSDDDKGASMLM